MLLLQGCTGCGDDERCSGDQGCSDEPSCDTAAGSCASECEQDSDCGGAPYRCEDHSCVLRCEDDALECPGGMVSICGSYCIDSYEASRPDATENEAGKDESMATSRPGVLPWQSAGLTSAEATAACEAAGKRLCKPKEWEVACGGADERLYCYGDEYDAATCNGIDAWCDKDCGVYQDCYRDCDSDYQLAPTGSFAGCSNGLGVLDMSGNVWEAVASSDGADHFRGGAYNCGDPGLAHSCSYDGVVAGTFPTVRGFRCCAEGEASR